MIQPGEYAARMLHQHGALAPSMALCLAVGASLCFSLLVFPQVTESWTAPLDPDRYGELARNVYHGSGLSYDAGDVHGPATNRGPAYPYLLAILYAIVRGENTMVVQLVQALLHGCTGILVFLLGRRLYSRRVGLTAQVVHGLHPILIWYTARIWVETLHTLLVVAVAFAVVLLLERATVTRIAWLGALLALSVLTKSILLLLPVPLLIYSFLKGSRETTRGLVGATILAALLVLPWTVRNYQLTGGVIPVHTSLGRNMVQGGVLAEHGLPLAHHALWLIGDARADSILEVSGFGLDTPQGDARLTHAVLGLWVRQPLVLIRHLTVNGATFWYLGETPAKSLLAIVLQLPLLTLLAVALITGKWTRTAIPLVIMIGYFWCLHALIFGWLRFSVPVIPLVVLVGLGGLMTRHNRDS